MWRQPRLLPWVSVSTCPGMPCLHPSAHSWGLAEATVLPLQGTEGRRDSRAQAEGSGLGPQAGCRQQPPASARRSFLRAGFDLPLWFFPLWKVRFADLPRVCTEMPLWSESQGRNWQGDTWTLVGPLMGRAEQGWAPEHLPW